VAWVGETINRGCVKKESSAFLKKSAQKTFAGGLGLLRCLFIAPAGGDEETPELPQPARKSFLPRSRTTYFFQKK